MFFHSLNQKYFKSEKSFSINYEQYALYILLDSIDISSGQ